MGHDWLAISLFTFGAKSSRSGYSVQIGVRILGHVIVEHDINSLDIHTTPKQVCGHQNSLAEILTTED